MKNRGLFLIAILLTVGVLAGASSRKGYVIKGRIDGKNIEGKAVYLYSGAGPFFFTDQIVDSARIVGGKFEFRGNLPHPDIYTLKFFDDFLTVQERSKSFISGRSIPVFLSDGTVSIEAEYEKIPMSVPNMTYNYDFSPFRVSGPSDFETFIDYTRGKHEVLAPEDDLWDEYAQVYSSTDIQARINYVNKANAVAKNVNDYAVDFIKRNSDNTVGLWAFRDNLRRLSHDDIKSLSAGFSDKMKASPLGVKILADAAKAAKSAVGAPFADFTLQDPDGRTVRLSDHLGKGRYVLLEFWSSTCGPCRFDIPHLIKVYEMFHPDGFDIISISMDSDHNMWLNTLGVSHMPWLQLSDLKAFDGEISKIYNFNALPTSILIGPDGKIVNRNFRGPHMDKGLVDIYGNKFSKR